jgi:glycine cleavage system regulatory protein
MPVVRVACLGAILLGPVAGVHADKGGQAAPATGALFEAALDSRLSISWTHKPVREALADLSQHLRLAVLLDRRIDPSLPLDNVHGERVREVLESIASQAGAELRILGNVAYLGPRPAANVVRTLAALRDDELSDLPPSLVAKLRRPSTLAWNDLDRPDEVLAKVAERYDLQVEGFELVPLDMWAGVTLPETSAGEQLTLVLVQLGLTFEWQPSGQGIRIVPIPDVVALRRDYPVRGARAEVLAQRGREEIDGIEADAEEGRLRVVGTLEQHERLAELLRAGSSVGSRPAASASRRKRTTTERLFSLRVSGGSLQAVLDLLEREHGFRVVVDEDSLSAAGVSTETQVQLDADRVGIRELLVELLDPIGLAYELDGREIRVFARRQP